MSMLICGKKNDRSFRYRLGRSTLRMAVAAYTHDKLHLPNSRHSPTKDISLQRLNGLNAPRMPKPVRGCLRRDQRKFGRRLARKA